MLKYLRAFWLTVITSVRYETGRINDDQLYDGMNRARAMIGKPPVTDDEL